MNRDVASRVGFWRQAWRLTAAAAVGVPMWLSIGVVMAHNGTLEGNDWYYIGDPLVAIGCLTALLWRQRFPLAIALVVVIASSGSALAAGAGFLALCSISVRRRPVEIGLVTLAYVAVSQFVLWIYTPDDYPGQQWSGIVVPMLAAGVAVAIGAAVGARRVEVRSLRDRAESAEREQAARVAQAQAMERNRIAREMHDVLAHRITLVAVQAGALGYRDDLASEESRVLVQGISEGSHRALEDLRGVLGVLRADPDAPNSAHPCLDRIPELVAEAQASGLGVTLTNTVVGEPSEVVGRTCYRIIQEGLTNAAKHAPGATVDIELKGSHGDGLHVSVRNSPATSTIARPPSSGFGLLGLAERVTLAGGRLEHHPVSGNGYLLAAQLPWPEQPSKESMSG